MYCFSNATPNIFTFISYAYSLSIAVIIKSVVKSFKFLNINIVSIVTELYMSSY